jgi:hypothetical protein
MRQWATVVNITVAGGGNRGLLYYVNAVGVAARYWLLEGWGKVERRGGWSCKEEALI